VANASYFTRQKARCKAFFFTIIVVYLCPVFSFLALDTQGFSDKPRLFFANQPLLLAISQAREIMAV
jgi:hypothetical protein